MLLLAVAGKRLISRENRIHDSTGGMFVGESFDLIPMSVGFRSDQFCHHRSVLDRSMESMYGCNVIGMQVLERLMHAIFREREICVGVRNQ